MSLADNRRQPPNPHELQSAFLCEIIQLCCIPLRDLRYLRENIHARVLQQSPKKPQCLSQISLIIADETLKHTLIPTCLSLRNNTACCIPLRNLRNLRENIHMRVLNLLAQIKPQSIPQISQITQTNNKQQTTKQP